MYGTLHMSGGYLRFNGSFIKSLPIPDIFPDSISSLGKILQFLFQLRYDFNSLKQAILLKDISKEIIERNIDFCENLTNSLINQLYIKKPVFNELEKLLDSDNRFPNINFRYNIPHFKLPKFKIYNINELPIILCYSGVTHESGSVHDKLRKIYLHEETTIIKNYKILAEIAWKARFALMKKDWKHLGEYFKMNTEIMNRIMKNAAAYIRN